MMHALLFRLTLTSLAVVVASQALAEEYPCYSGRYPHLAVFNEQRECGIGAVVPWAGRLWITTYAPHRPLGSDDGLYEITKDLRLTRRPESVGGTPANRLIHRESNQLFISHYAIDAKGKVRAISPKRMPGRLTATARSLDDPANKVYHYTMEEGLYGVDVRSLELRTLYPDGNQTKHGTKNPLLPGYHGKGAYTAQGRLVVANNGEPPRRNDAECGPSGSLAEWDGHDWTVVERKQFTEVTGPGGVHGNAGPDDPLWTVGWDHRSLILKVLDDRRWHTFRLPIACYSYVARHGWHTEWPRIREVVPAKNGRPPKLLMNMHGTWFDFPPTFSARNTTGLRPVASHLKITGDFCHWHGRIVFGCDDAAKTGLLTKEAKPPNRLVGQSQSNLWFTSRNGLGEAGRAMGWGGPWVHDDVADGAVSDPYLIAGYPQRVLHLAHATDATIRITVDARRAGRWQTWKTIEVPAQGYRRLLLPGDLKAEWVRLRVDGKATDLSAYFHFGPGGGALTDSGLFAGLASAAGEPAFAAGLIRPRGANLRTLHAAALRVDQHGRTEADGYYEIGSDMRLRRVDDAKSEAWLREKARIDSPGFTVDAASVIVTDGEQRYRLPKGHAAFDTPTALGWPRGVREVCTERSLLNAHGSFYLLPAPTSGGVRRIKPIATHNRSIMDFCSWRGMLVLSGCRLDAKTNPHLVRSDDGQFALWFGDVDDLWKLGKPRGRGGPWKESAVTAGHWSDPYLMACYDRKTLRLSHDATAAVKMMLQVDFLADGTWCTYKTWHVPPGETLTYAFPDGYSAHWARLRCDRACTATARFTYE